MRASMLTSPVSVTPARSSYCAITSCNSPADSATLSAAKPGSLQSRLSGTSSAAQMASAISGTAALGLSM